jgi:hypothetical protein
LENNKKTHSCRLAECAPKKRQLADIARCAEAPLALRRYVSIGLPLSFYVSSVHDSCFISVESDLDIKVLKENKNIYLFIYSLISRMAHFPK